MLFTQVYQPFIPNIISVEINAVRATTVVDIISQDHYIGIDVGTGSARACLIDASGDIKALASEPIKLWQPQTGYYVRIGKTDAVLSNRSLTDVPRNNRRRIYGLAFARVFVKSFTSLMLTLA